MLEVISLVNFDNPQRVAYLERSFASFYRFNPREGVRHWVLDSSRTLTDQAALYSRFGLAPVHRPGATFGERLKLAMTLVQNDYFLFLPDDFHWIFAFPVTEAINECRRFAIDELKLTARGMPWYSVPGATPQSWFTEDRVISGEVLRREGNLRVSRRRWLRDFHEQFSLACNVLRADFARYVVERLPAKVRSPGEAEKYAYLRLLFKRYAVAYYRMWIPAFHFIDLSVEGAHEHNKAKAATSLVEANFAIYNEHYNR